MDRATIKLRLLSGRQLQVQICPLHTVAELKASIVRLDGDEVDMETLKLVFDDNLLEDHGVVRDLGISSGDDVQVVFVAVPKEKQGDLQQTATAVCQEVGRLDLQQGNAGLVEEVAFTVAGMIKQCFETCGWRLQEAGVLRQDIEVPFQFAGIQARRVAEEFPPNSISLMRRVFWAMHQDESMFSEYEKATAIAAGNTNSSWSDVGIRSAGGLQEEEVVVNGEDEEDYLVNPAVFRSIKINDPEVQEETKYAWDFSRYRVTLDFRCIPWEGPPPEKKIILERLWMLFFLRDKLKEVTHFEILGKPDVHRMFNNVVLDVLREPSIVVVFGAVPKLELLKVSGFEFDEETCAAVVSVLRGNTYVPKFKKLIWEGITWFAHEDAKFTNEAWELQGL